MKSRWLIRAASMVGLVVLWQVVAWIADSDVLPTPWAVCLSLFTHTLSGDLPYHLSITLARVAVSFVLAMAIGTAIGIAAGFNPRQNTLNTALQGVGW
mgnify:CR=1 FL=1